MRPIGLMLLRGAGAALALLVALLPFGPAGLAHVCDPDPDVGVAGALLVPSGSGLTRISLPDRGAATIPVLPTSGVVTQVARSLDGARLAVARFSRPAQDPVGGSDVLITGSDGGAPLAVIGRERPGEMLGAPAWLPDGSLIFERQTAAGAGAGSRLERANADGSGRQPLLDHAAAPAVSADGRWLVFLRSERTERLMIRSLEDGGEHPLVDDPRLLALTFPRFSPDASWVAFSAVADPSAVAPPARTALGFLLPGAGLVHAHGLPWDVWLVRTDGSDLRRLTFYLDDDPAPAWSPDGRWLAISGTESLKVISPDGQTGYCVLGTGAYGGLVWY